MVGNRAPGHRGACFGHSECGDEETGVEGCIGIITALEVFDHHKSVGEDRGECNWL